MVLDFEMGSELSRSHLSGASGPERETLFLIFFLSVLIQSDVRELAFSKEKNPMILSQMEGRHLAFF